MKQKRYVKFGNTMISEQEAETIAYHPKRNALIFLATAALMLPILWQLSLGLAAIAVGIYFIAPQYRKALEGPRYTQSGEEL